MAYGKLRTALVCAGACLLMTTYVNAASKDQGVVLEETIGNDESSEPAEAEEELPKKDTEAAQSGNEGEADSGGGMEETPEDADDTGSTEQAGAGSWIGDKLSGWTYEENGALLKGLQTINGKTYYFDDAGVLQTGFQNVNGTERYYFNPNGEAPALGLGAMMQSVWIEDGNTVYYLREDGQPETGLKEVGTGNYFFDAEGKMLTGWQTDGKYTYYFKNTGTLGGTRGVMLRGWNSIGGKTYYFQKNGTLGQGKGSRYTGIIKIGSYRYYFDNTKDLGVLQTGWQDIGDNTYYFKMSGDPGVKGMMFTGFKSINKKIYYFQAGGSASNVGKMYTGWKTLNDGRVFYFKLTGEDGVKGQMFTGWKSIGGKIFYFKRTGAYGVRGARQTSWFTTGGKQFFFKRSGGYGVTGSLQLGWQKIDGKTYYFKQTGAYGTKGFMFKGWNNVGDDRFWFADNGAVKTGWQRYNNQWYYLKPKEKGAMATGWTYVPPSGSVYRDKSISSYKFYFRPNTSGGPKGSLMQDVSGLLGYHGNDGDFYRIEVDRTRCVVTVYAKDQNGQYRIPVKAMTCSVGLPNTPTPRSSYEYPFRTIEKMRWGTLMGPSYGQYCTRVVAGILFHSVAGSNTTSYNLSAGNYNMLGYPASHGCIRLCVRDAKWIYDNIKTTPGGVNTQVVIRDNMYQPFDKPATIKIPAGQNWDPTDPNI